MIFLNHYQKWAPNCMQMTLVLFTKMSVPKKLKTENVKMKSFRHCASCSYTTSCQFIMENIKLRRLHFFDKFYTGDC